LTYQRFRELFSGERWAALEARGAQKQRLLWASTGTKNPAYNDVLYVEELIGPDTVNTIPPSTYDAFRDHGRVRPTLETGLEEARETLAKLGDDFAAVTDRLLEEGLDAFVKAFETLLAAVGAELRSDRQTASLPGELQAEVDAVVEEWRAEE